MSKTRKNKGFPKKGDPITQTQESKEKKTRKSSKKSKSPKRKRVVSDDSEYESDDDEHDLDIPSDDPEDDFNILEENTKDFSVSAKKKREGKGFGGWKKEQLALKQTIEAKGRTRNEKARNTKIQ